MNEERDYKDVVINDKDRDVRIRVYKMDCVSAQNWLLRLGALLARAGVPLPKKVATKTGELGAMVAGALQDGYLFRMPGLDPTEIQALLQSLLRFAYVVIPNPKGGGPVMLSCEEETTLASQFKSVASLFKLYGEIGGYSFGFFGQDESLDTALDRLQSKLSNMQTSIPLSEASSPRESPSETSRRPTALKTP